MTGYDRSPIEGAVRSAVGGERIDLYEMLDNILRRFRCAVGTVHALDPASGMLLLRAQRGVPETLLTNVEAIPVSVGMASLAAERRQPVHGSGLHVDRTGIAEGAISVPILVGESLRGVLGIARPTPYDFNREETGLLLHVGSLIGTML